MRTRRLLAVILMAAVMLWTVAPVLAASRTLGTPAAGQGAAPEPKGGSQAVTPGSASVLQDAIKELQHTRLLLVKDAANDYQGRKATAIQDIDQAIQQLRLALQYSKK